MCEVTVISTSEEAKRAMDALDACKQAARVDDYAAERRRPIRWLECTCCGEGYQGRQWWNQDCGYGLGDCCVETCGASTTPGVESVCYGVAGIHFLVPQAEKDNPPIVKERGRPLFDLDERLRVECDGYVYWQGVCVEHYSDRALANTPERHDAAREIIRRCEILEGEGRPVDMGTVIWTWRGE